MHKGNGPLGQNLANGDDDSDANKDNDGDKDDKANNQADNKDGDTNMDESGEDGASARTGGFSDIPPSLKCALCIKLIKNATLTPCCFTSCCYECLRTCLTTSSR